MTNNVWVKARIKKGWQDAGKIFFILGNSVRANVMDWTPIIYDGDEDPSWIKTSAIEIIEQPIEPIESNSEYKYFIEDKRNGKWLCFGDGFIDTRRSLKEENELRWTNDPNLALSWNTKEEAELHNKKYWNMIDIEVTEHEFVKQSPQKVEPIESDLDKAIKWCDEKLNSFSLSDSKSFYIDGVLQSFKEMKSYLSQLKDK